MTDETRGLGRELGHTKSIPEYVHFVICIGSAVLFGAMWQAELAHLPFLIAGAVLGMVELYILAYRIPALHSSLTIYENGLKMVVQGKSTVFAYDQLNRLEANFTHKKLNDQSWGTKVRIEFFLDERSQPFIYATEFRRNNSGEQLVALALEKCSQAI